MFGCCNLVIRYYLILAIWNFLQRIDFYFFRRNNMADLAKLVDNLSSLTVLEAAELSKMLEEKWGVSAAAPVAVAAAGAAGGAAAVEEKTAFDVILASAG